MSTQRMEPSALSRFSRERNEIVAEVIESVTRDAIQRAWESPEDGLEYLLNEAAFLEMDRLEDTGDVRHDPGYQYWKKVAYTIGRVSEEENAELLQRIVARYANDIAGNFSPAVFTFATSVIPHGISLLFARPKGTLSLEASMRALKEQVQFSGDLDQLRALSKKGTLVYVPTHSSHMDSMLIGWALHAVGLPPVMYGAGKNLFTNPMTSFFMANLGAYKVDRRLRHTIYKRVLKSYSQRLLERGYHSLFFPGGGRSRSNEVEQRLKLGLLGTTIDAWVQQAVKGQTRPMYIVPVTINYNLILEAETMVEDHLRADGKNRYIIDIDEFSDLRRVATFVRSSFGMQTAARIHFCPPMDILGHQVDDSGRSIDAFGREIDIEKFIQVNGVPTADRRRDAQYTRELGAKVAQSFSAHNVIYPLHIASFAIFEHLRRQHPQWDLYRVLRFSKGDSVLRQVAEGEIERVTRILRRLAAEGRLLLSEEVQEGTAKSILAEAATYWRTYHQPPIAEVDGRSVRLLNLNLLYFYGNRLRGYDIEPLLDSAPGGYS